MSSAKQMTVGQVAELVGADRLAVNGSHIVSRVAAPENADEHSIVFAETAEALNAALASRAGVVLSTREQAAACDDQRVVGVKDPRYAFAQCARALEPQREAEIDASAAVHATARLGARVRIGARVVVEAGTVIGDDTSIEAGAVIKRGTRLGNRVVVQSGAVLGATGFGYVRSRDTGEYLLFPQQGTLVVEDDVEIGANTTVDRGALGETRIGRGTKIDNLVHIGHNCRIGRNVVIAAQVGISGSCVVEDGAVLAGQVGISDHCKIGPGVILGGQAGVFRGKSVEGPGEMFAGTPAEPLRDFLKGLAKVRRL